MNQPYNPVADELAPQSGDIKRLLALKIAKMLYGAIFDGVPLNVTGISGGGGGATADNSLAATTLNGLKGIDTAAAAHVEGDWILVRFSGEAAAIWMLQDGNNSDDLIYVRPNDYDAGTNNVYWERVL